jgi:hypothetical protein
MAASGNHCVTAKIGRRCESGADCSVVHQRNLWGQPLTAVRGFAPDLSASGGDGDGHSGNYAHPGLEAQISLPREPKFLVPQQI